MILVIDGSHLAYRSYHAFLNFTNAQGDPTGMLYGFLSILSSYTHRISDKIIITWDEKPYWRTEYYPEYKFKNGVKKEDPADLKRSFEILYEVISYTGIIEMRKKYFEADDLIAFLCDKLGKDVSVLSGDNDLIQLVNDARNIRIIKPGKNGSFQIYNEKEVKSETGVTVDMMPAWLAITGGHDNIKGITGLGPKKTARLINENPNLLQTIKDTWPEDYARIEMNINLVDLHQEDMMLEEIESECVKYNKPDILKLNQALALLEIQSITSKELIDILYNKKLQSDLKELLEH